MQRRTKASKWKLVLMRSPRLTDSSLRLRPKVIMTILATFTLACTFLSPDIPATSRRIVILTRLPTFTPTPSLATSESEPAFPPSQVTSAPEAADPPAVDFPTEATVVTPTPTSPPPQPATEVQSPMNDPNETPLSAAPTERDTQASPLPDPVATPAAPSPDTTNVTTIPDMEADGWSFTDVQVYTDQIDNGFLMYGDVINNTGSAQELDYITGTFYDAQGQVIAGEENVIDSWPLDIIPPGARVPFGLTVEGVQNVANLELNLYSEPSEDLPSQDFEFLNTNPSIAVGSYCVNGQLQNLGGELEGYLVIVLVLYNDQNKMINFAEYPEPYFEELVGGETLPFEICVDNFKQNVARYDLRAWGQ